MIRSMPVHIIKSASDLARQSEGETPVLTVEAIRALRQEIVADERKLAEIRERLPLKKKRLDAALLFVTDAQRKLINQDEPEPSAPAGPGQHASVTIRENTHTAENFDLAPDDETLTYPIVIERIVGEAGRGLSHAEITAAIEASPLADRFSQSTKAYYNTISRLEKRKKIIRENGLFYSPRLHQQLKKQGASFPGGNSTRRAEGSGALVLKVLKGQKHGLTAQEIRERMTKIPETPRSIADHKHYIYNVLAPLVGDGTLEKEGEKYFLAEEVG